MKFNEDNVDLILHNDTLNKAQAELLGLTFPLESGWETFLLEKELDTRLTNLLILLKGDLTQKVQKQIIQNYEDLSSFRKPKKTEPVKTEQTSSPSNSGALEIYCDGACSGNPGEAGSGLAVYQGGAKPTLYHGAYVENGTNNIAELNAFSKALQLCEANEGYKNTILSDSKYSIDCICNWAYSWKAKGWTKKSGEIKNLELIQAAHALFDKIKDHLVIKHVKGHAGVEGNELADRMAVHTIKAKNEEYQEYSYESIDFLLSLKSY